VKTLAVLPFTVRGGDDVRHLGEGMADLLAAKLNDGSGFRAADPHAVMAALENAGPIPIGLDEGTLVAKRVQAGWMITGQLVEIAGRLEVSATLYELRANPRVAATASVSGETTALFQLVDDLTGRLLAGIAVGRDTSLVRLSALTTTSLPALMAFLEGEQALRAGLDARAMTAYRRAVDLDSTFAIACYRLALSATWASLPGSERSAEWAAQAARHADHLSPFARDLVRGYAAYKDLRAEEAERTYRALVSAHPDNVEGWMMLGETLFHYGPARGRPSSEGRAPFERALALDADNPHALTHLARQAALDGRAEALDSLIDRYSRAHASAERLLEMQALAAFVRNDSAGRVAVADAAHEVGDAAFVGVLQGGLDYAENPAAYTDLLPAARRVDRRFVGLAAILMQMTDVEAARGRFTAADVRAPFDSPLLRAWRLETEALLAAERAFEVPEARVRELRTAVSRQPSYPKLNQYTPMAPFEAGTPLRHYLVGLLSLRLGDTLTAKGAGEELLRSEPGPEGEWARSFGIALRAEALRARGEPAKALATLDSFPLALEHLRVFAHYGIRERFVRGELLSALGRDQEAIAVYGSLTNAYDLPFVALSHLRRATITARRGDRDAARFHYARFLRWYGEADPERQPLVTAAREALAQLER
jgi:tetratricopeptide (TPR) repeat protein